MPFFLNRPDVDFPKLILSDIGGASKGPPLWLSDRLFWRRSPKPTTTPWGDVANCAEIAPGIFWFTTATRAGYQLSPQRHRGVPFYLRTEDGFYEDKSEWAAVTVVFDRIFDRMPSGLGSRNLSVYEIGKEILKNWRPEKYEAWFQTILEPAEIAGLAITQFYRSHADRWIAIEALDPAHADVVDGKVLVRAKWGGDPPYSADLGVHSSQTRSFLVDADVFVQHRGKPFLVDSSFNAEIFGAGLPETIAAWAKLAPDHRLAGASPGMESEDDQDGFAERLWSPAATAMERDETHTGQLRDPERKLERDLREAVASMAFEILYQPQIDLRTRRVTAFEALLRWRHPGRGAVPPAEFIPLAEETGLIDEIGRWVLEQACQDAAKWPENVRVAVNVSTVQFENGRLTGTVGKALRRAKLDPSRLELEITASGELKAGGEMVAVLRELRASGVRIVIDDFGNSGFDYLLHLFPDKIKIDRSLITGLGKGEARRAVVQALIGLCGKMGVICTAQGVETETQLEVLLGENCPEAQGRLFSEALTIREIPDFLKLLNFGRRALFPTASLPPLGAVALAQIAETANDIIIVTTAELDPPGPRIVYVNPAFTRLTGYAASEAIGHSPRILQRPGTSRAMLDSIHESLRKGQPVHEKVLNFAKSGTPYWVDMRIVPLRDAGGAITHFAAIERDVTMDKRRLEELESLANRDTLTGIPNRRAILRTLKAEVECVKAFREGSRVRANGPCLAFIDVDNFKRVNDEKGHAAGDAVLCGVADRLAEIVRRSDTLGRIGGEEFAVCMPRVPLREGKAIAERLRRAVAAQPFETPAGPLAATVSIGVTAYRPGDTPMTLMARADAAMYAAKQAGRDKVREDLGETAETRASTPSHID
jgi:diguanylate cyclase (GGDEF)-like protein/PAS domain S-box-containing protein